MRKNKSILILAAVAAIVLLGAWFSGGTPEINTPDSSTLPVEATGLSAEDPSDANEAESTQQDSATAGRNTLPQESNATSELLDSIENTPESTRDNLRELPEDLSETDEESDDLQLEDESELVSQGASESRPTQGASAPSIHEPTPRPTQGAAAATPTPRPTQVVATATPTPRITEEPEAIAPHVAEQESQIFGEDHPNMRDPVEPEDLVVGDESFIVTLEVRVDMILHNMHLLHRDKHELIPPDGVIFPRTKVSAYEGESVFNVLQREMRRNNIHMASRFTPIFNSAYVEAINNLYEFDVGGLSGWMYKVNGWFPNFGASRYTLSPGDEIVWQYTVDLGRDLGVDWLDGGQLDE
ncbi:MAG: DUF4430 domain-containing protein [Defluviitaleaceae bacterium]|nr:DUF4430 domain-containing protein [Defluviitaleaceae bacterium]